jgi:hypothetical protein
LRTATPQYHDHSPVEEALMRRQALLNKVGIRRVAMTAATMVTLVATVGAPFKWSMRWIPLP